MQNHTHQNDLVPIRVTPNRNESQLAEFELKYSDEDLNNLSIMLSELEQNELDELSRIANEKKQERPFIKDLLDVVVKGAIEYVNSITDTSETFDDIKNPSSVSRHDGEVIDKKSKPAWAGTERDWNTRTIKEAQQSAFDKNARMSTDNMSAKGIERLSRYQKAYSQRSKFLTQTSVGENKINKSDFNVNAQSLAGIESYRFGPMVPPTPISELKELYSQDVASGKCDSVSRSSWIRKHNYNKLDQQLMETFGFKTKKEAERFRTENNLTPHEGPNGICLIPSDLHDAVSHNGYATKVSQVLSGKMTEQEMTHQLRLEKIKICKHEISNRGKRAGKGALLSLAKDVAIFSIGVLGREVYDVFKRGESKFLDKVKIVMHNVWIKIKTKVQHFMHQLMTGFIGNIVNETLTAINDFIFKTAKNIFRVIRMMWKSLYNALRTIFCSKATWGERLYEATKILAAGAVGVLGITLNELIEKFLTSIHIPFASVFADILSGLLGGIMSALMLFMFDKARKQIFETKKSLTHVNAEERLMTIRDAKTEVALLSTNRYGQETIQQFGYMLMNIQHSRANIFSSIEQIQTANISNQSLLICERTDSLLNTEF